MAGSQPLADERESDGYGKGDDDASEREDVQH
jgi:hypothetical protein